MATALPDTIADLVRQFRGRTSRLLLCGAPGTDRVTPCGLLAGHLAGSGREILCLAADTALPVFGAPGALSLARWGEEGWMPMAMQPLCTLDPVRFRLPLIEAAVALLQRAPTGTLLVQAPGLGGGAAGDELLGALARVARMEAVVFLHPEPGPAIPPPVLRQLRVPIYSQPVAGRRSRAERRAQRDRLWRRYLGETAVRRIPLEQVGLSGTPPPLADSAAWQGRQVAVLENDRLCGMGEVLALDAAQVTLRMPSSCTGGDRLLLRDAVAVDGSLQSVRREPGQPETLPAAPEAGFLEDFAPIAKCDSSGPVPVARIGQASACLVNGVFGDPLLKLQLLHQRRNLLFDLGDPGRMSARVAHQVSDLFLSHTHADHIGGFLWFLRSRIGELPACRVYGPPGVAGQIAGLVGGVLWDRVEERAPRFEIREWHDDHLRCYRVVAGAGDAMRLQDLPLLEGVVWQEGGFRVRAERLDHRTPVLAYAWESSLRVRVRRERLAELGLPPGRWLQVLKQAVLAQRSDQMIVTPDGATHRVGELQAGLLLEEPGQKLVYATDFADSADNRRRLVALAAGAHSLFCEASFMVEDAAQAHRTQHLTTRACAEIANEAQVAHLLPFHFSRRYIQRAPEVYREIGEFTSRVVMPGFLAAGEA